MRLSLLLGLLIATPVAPGPAPAPVAPQAEAKKVEAKKVEAKKAEKKKPKPEPELPGVVYHGPRTAPLRVALTFDACSLKHDKLDEAVLATLETLRVPATVFLGGHWAEDMGDAVERLKKNPDLELQSHAYWHPHLTALKPEKLAAELHQAQVAFEKAVGRKATMIRAPYGELDARVVKAMTDEGLTPVQYDLPSGDPDPRFTVKRLTKWVLGEAQGGSIVVLHINGNGKHTAEALPGIVEGLRKKGFELVTVGALLAGPDAGADLDGGAPAPLPLPDAGAPDSGR
jgi:peptidoglycan/xylan/chitin deacetylase (PgdA/CDA1 family)